MPRFWTVAAVLAITALAAVAAVLIAGDDEADAPEGFETFEGSFGDAGFELALPPDWGEVTEREGASEDERVYQAEGPTGDDGTGPGLYLGIAQDGPSPEAALELNTSSATLRVADDYEVTDEGETDVPGAAEAIRATAEYTAETEAGEPLPSRQEMLLARTAAGTTFVLIVSESADAPSDDAESILDSLRIEE